MSVKPFVFPYEDFIAEFPEFSSESFTVAQTTRCGIQASRYITEWQNGFPLAHKDDRLYALFLLTAHILVLRKSATDDLASDKAPIGGRIIKSSVGAVSVSMDTGATSNQDEYSYWLSQTAYGQELLAYLANSAPAGIYINTCRDSVRVL